MFIDFYRKNQGADMVAINLVTWNEPEYQETSIVNFEEIKDSLSQMNIEFNYEFKESAF
ncbi:hypothetical protein GCM10022217_10790 [Chryseobacterium ginsenosidimutans]|uniref:MIT C-terminal domain-containing protein n=1 Tax=Chryseobacterium ginsenosidimutans TaxID=687846 RepID=UPI00337FA2F3